MPRERRDERQATEVYFYHLERRTLEDVLPTLLLRSLESGWRAAVQAASEERVEALDTLLWTYREESFLPHGTPRTAASEQPIYLTAGADNPNAAQVASWSTARNSATRRSYPGWCLFSTAATPMRWRGRGRNGRQRAAPVTQSATGSRMRTGAGSRKA